MRLLTCPAASLSAHECHVTSCYHACYVATLHPLCRLLLRRLVPEYGQIQYQSSVPGSPSRLFALAFRPTSHLPLAASRLLTPLR